MKYTFLTVISTLLFCFTVTAQENYKDINTKTEYQNADTYTVVDIKDTKHSKTPKNIILLIGDGMGPAHFYAGLTANHGALNILNMKHIGLSKTKSADKYVTDSAAGGTALASGQKTNNGAIGVDVNEASIPTILEQAESLGKATGLVSTSSITHATPASFIAHQPKRSMYEEIAADFLNTEFDVAIGGGHKFFTDRTDKRNLLTELEAKGYTTAGSLDQVKDVSSGNMIVLTAPEHNAQYAERGDLLPQATKKAIEVLHNNSKKGFFLMVEGSQIDWGAHQNDITYVVQEMLDFDRAVGEALKFAEEDGNTLVIVTADHETGGITILDGDETKGYVKVGFSTGHHTGLAVPVYTYGSGAKEFIGMYENTEIYHKMARLWKIEQ